MARPKGTTKPPTMRFHKGTGQWYTKVAGCAALYWGRDKAEAERKFGRWLAERGVRGGVTPIADYCSTVSQVIAGYLGYMAEHFGVTVLDGGRVVSTRPNDNAFAAAHDHACDSFRTLRGQLRLLNELYGPIMANDFDATALMALQRELATRPTEAARRTPKVYHKGSGHRYDYVMLAGKARYLGLKGSDESRAAYERFIETVWTPYWQSRDTRRSRNGVNAAVSAIRRMFSWAAVRKMVHASTYHGLLGVKPLQYNRGGRESRKVEAVDAPRVDAAKRHLPQIIRDIIDVQQLAGMRPAEALQIRGIDIKTGIMVEVAGERLEVWHFRPGQHKGLAKGKERVIPLGRAAIEILRRRLKTDLRAYAFNTADLRDEWKDLRDAKREEKHAELRRLVGECGGNLSAASRQLGVPVGGVWQRLRLLKRRRNPDELRIKLSPFISETVYARYIRGACDKAGIERWHPHQLRHAFVTQAFDATGELDTAQQAVGHSDRAMTQHYLTPNLKLANKYAAVAG